MQTKLQQALRAGLRPGGDLVSELKQCLDYPVESRQDALAICRALRKFPRSEDPILLPSLTFSPLQMLVYLFQAVETQEAFNVLCEQGLPELARIFDAQFEHPEANCEEMLYLLKMFAAYSFEEAIPRIVVAAQDEHLCNGMLWPAIFSQFDEADSLREELMDNLSDPLPKGFARVAFLDFVNELALDGELEDHPFDCEEGVADFEKWLLSSEPDELSFAQSATGSLPFLSGPARENLLALALDHLSEPIQLEAAWAAAYLDRAPAVRFLQRYCLDPYYSVTACHYLEEVGREEAIPEAAREPDFRALSEMCLWLSHPSEFGTPPDEIEPYDSRVMFWPPTNDERQVWLFRYRYFAEEPGEEDDTGIGMVGSTTFALFGESSFEMSPEDVYALHCCWELQQSEDPRAPKERSVEVGKRLLEEYDRYR
ncbi:Hypothetical protein PBC10988_28130 [Planctomycetales bacterium 10988]|nr:Hypothetical protein PBC10988_28130 [Planctomycetales bacterium 10988]